ncbi:MAG: bifunctional diaminohydroxyphosphoribosylaminopyrimidine deaminase/5-amino-6-(5-phosphoribosylamino)uracil reductase RibD [Thermoleophilia bacterium]|nr:bifunctional diaminohydroxyphosphoribosylaminopyrimidine deaminase/5-amino-6-(5-phosphoribosylamino)uracil reductase RibD [Thermoleophilia bacterium]
MDENDKRYLERALDLAENGRGCTSPNPMVGAVIVRGGEIIGEGWHVGPGNDHAEVAAVRDAVRRAGLGGVDMPTPAVAAAARPVCAGTTMYVSLEPCCTYGRTPPCTAALLAGGFARVVAAALDPTPQVNGNGVKALRDGGAQVDIADGPLAHRAMRQNNGARKAISTGLPFVVYKYAMTLDGRVAADSGDARWISGAESRALVHRWRSWSDAVMVGSGTLAADDPELTARDVPCRRQPLRVVLDRRLTIRADSRIVSTTDVSPVLIVCGETVGDSRRREVESWGLETVSVTERPEAGLDTVEVARMLAARGVQNVLLEGGSRLAGSWWAAGLIDEIAAFVCPRIVSGEKNRSPLRGPGAALVEAGMVLQETDVRSVDPDLLITGYVRGPY